MVGTSRRHILSTLIPHLRQHFALQTPPSNAFSTSTIQRKSPFESNLVRMLTSEIEFDSEYAPPHQTEKKFNAFMVEDRPGGQFVTLRGRSTIDENIKIEATMFDGVSPNMDEDDNEPNAQLHISLLVDIFKGEGGDMLEFVCSAWPQRLEIQKLYVIRPGGTLSRPYIGPDFRGCLMYVGRFVRRQGFGQKASECNVQVPQCKGSKQRPLFILTSLCLEQG
ncbi:uncharacterized protein At2g39795, mitochondrial isoform X3 [Helianthus annuus]|uniref:uncharacterized protein At2g39795, mitochondrial isoform X3 n=1 Tax=Helianthus annuus TaxID=4232 RepID=UPI000B8FB6AE|nr:uncharacterized protein At2g39795, mitochondrial isoform X3 [Helianthus annuus]